MGRPILVQPRENRWILECLKCKTFFAYHTSGIDPDDNYGFIAAKVYNLVQRGEPEVIDYLNGVAETGWPMHCVSCGSIIAFDMRKSRVVYLMSDFVDDAWSRPAKCAAATGVLARILVDEEFDGPAKEYQRDRLDPTDPPTPDPWKEVQRPREPIQ